MTRRLDLVAPVIPNSSLPGGGSAEAAPAFLRPKSVAIRFGISVSEVYRAIYAGEIEVTRFKERVLLIRPEDADRWFQANCQ